MELRDVSRKALANFRRRARRRLPNEYIEAIWGRENTDGSVSIREFRPIAHEASPEDVVYDEADVRFGERDGDLMRLGGIHTHPGDCYCAPSEQDWHSSHSSDEYITGILHIPSGRKRSRVQFYYAKALCHPKIR